jgi:hypothetical protein
LSQLNPISNNNINFARSLSDTTPLVKKINLDTDLAKIGTICMLLKSLLSFHLPDSELQDPSKISVVKILDELLRKVRQQCQYTIHARPADINRQADDIMGDRVHNLEAHALGRLVYNLNAFVGPWLTLAKIFLHNIFPYHSPILGLAPRLLDFGDNLIGKMTNIFWNLRRISKSMIAYDGGITSQALGQKQNDVRDIISFCLKSYIFRPLQVLRNTVLNSNEANATGPRVRHYTTEHIKELKEDIKRDYWNNIKACWTKKYTCIQDGKTKEIGSEEPDNHKLYVRSKILSQVMGLPVGIIGTLLNSLGLGLNGIAAITNNGSLRTMSDKCTDYANGLMSLLYITGEVPANVNEFLKKIARKGVYEFRHLGVAAIGALGMLNRIKILPVFNSILHFSGIKYFLDLFDKPFQNFFLLFFSYNRMVIHKHELLEAREHASSRDLMDASKHDNIWSQMILPLRILFQDKTVSYTDEKSTQGTMAPTLAA